MTAIGSRIYLAEIKAYRPDSSAPAGYGWGSRPRGAAARGGARTGSGALADSQTVRASDVGYCTEVIDGDVIPYPAVLASDWTLDRRLTLDPASTVAPLTVGALRLINAGRRFDQIVADYTCDSLSVRVLTGRRTYDPDRDYLVDPPSAGLSMLFGGLAEAWQLTERALLVPLRDATYWLERAYVQDVYTGAGGLSGSPELAGQTKPRARGGTLANPIRSVRPVLIDAVNRIYQYTDGPGQVAQVYEGGAPVFTAAGDVSDLWSGSTPGGSYRTDNSRGLFQLAGEAAGLITADVVGHFPTAGPRSTAGELARFILTEDLALPASLVDLASFAPTGAMARLSGWAWPSGDASTGAAALSPILRGAGAKLLPLRDGRLAALALKAVPTGAVPAARLTPARIIDLRSNRLGAPLEPPAYRWRVGCRRNHIVQTSGLNAGLSDAERREVGQEWRVAAWSSGAILAAYARPSDPAVLSTALLLEADAQQAGEDLGALWGRPRLLRDLDLPEELGMQLDLGDVVEITWPAGSLATGRPGLVVGEQIRTAGGNITLQVLI